MWRPAVGQAKAPRALCTQRRSLSPQAPDKLAMPPSSELKDPVPACGFLARSVPSGLGWPGVRNEGPSYVGCFGDGLPLEFRGSQSGVPRPMAPMSPGTSRTTVPTPVRLYLKLGADKVVCAHTSPPEYGHHCCGTEGVGAQPTSEMP